MVEHRGKDETAQHWFLAGDVFCFLSNAAPHRIEFFDGLRLGNGTVHDKLLD
jgi:hypothetical protein